jgi:hypothetical protein
MDKTEIKIWCCYGAFVVIGLLIFVGISCYVKTKTHICEEERALIRQYNKQLARLHGETKKNNHAPVEHGKETFSLFNLLS